MKFLGHLPGAALAIQFVFRPFLLDDLEPGQSSGALSPASLSLWHSLGSSARRSCRAHSGGVGHKACRGHRGQGEHRGCRG